MFGREPRRKPLSSGPLGADRMPGAARGLEMRSSRGSWAAAALLFTAGCAGQAKLPADASGVDALPPLPTTVEAALPSGAAHLLQLELDELRQSAPLSELESLVTALPCLQNSRSRTLLDGTTSLAVSAFDNSATKDDAAKGDATAGQPQRSGFVGFAASRQGPQGWLAAIAEGAGQQGVAPAQHNEGRYARVSSAEYSATSLGEPLVMFGTTGQVAASQARFDGASGPAAPAWDAIAADFRPAAGRVVSFATQSLPAAAARQLSGLAGARIASALAGAQVSAVVERTPLAVRVQARLATVEAATTLRREVHRQLDRSSFLLRLAGLPLHERLESSQLEATVRFDLPLRAAEAQRLLALAKAAWPPIGRRICTEVDKGVGR